MTLTTARTSSTLSRGAFLGGSVAVLLGGSALAAGPASATMPSEAKRPSLPSSWRRTIFASATPHELQGYVASYVVLRGYGAISSLSASKLRRAEGIASFLAMGDNGEGETFTPRLSRGVRLDAASTPVTFVGSAGTRVPAHVQLVRTANPKARALLVRVDGRRSVNRVLPRAQIVSALARYDTVQQLTTSDLRDLVTTAIALSFAEDGSRPSLTIDRLHVLDGGAHASARVRGTVAGRRVDGTWYATALPADGGYEYVFGKLPA